MNVDDFLNCSSFEETPVGPAENYFIQNHLESAQGKFFFECGAVNGFHLSQTATLEGIFKWDGILVEAHLELFDRLNKGDRQAKKVRAFVGNGEKTFFEQKSSGLLGHSQLRPSKLNDDCVHVQTKTIEQVLTEAGAPDRVDFMVIDVEWAWRDAFEGIDFDRRQIDFLAIEMKKRDNEILAAMAKRGFDLVRIMGGEDYLFSRS